MPSLSLENGLPILVDFLNSRPDRTATNNEIVNHFTQLLGFSRGQVAGLVRRARLERNAVELMQRGVYRLVDPVHSPVPQIVNESIKQAIERIQQQVSREIQRLSTEEFERIRGIICALEGMYVEE